MSLLLLTSGRLPYASALTNCVPSSSVEPEFRILRDKTKITAANAPKINTETYHGTILNKPLLPSAGDEEVCRLKLVTSSPSDSKVTISVYGPRSTLSLGLTSTVTDCTCPGLMSTVSGVTAGRHPSIKLPASSTIFTESSPCRATFPSFLTSIVVD